MYVKIVLYVCIEEGVVDLFGFLEEVIFGFSFERRVGKRREEYEVCRGDY